MKEIHSAKTVQMVFLSEVLNQWPWNPQVHKDLHDKEIYTQVVVPSETSEEWEIPISPPMPGFAYVGIRICVSGKQDQYSMYPRFVIGKQRFPVYGHSWDIRECKNTSWSTLGYPLVKRTFERGPITVLIAHNTPCFGRVELLAQRFDDLLENDQEISYEYYDPTLNEITHVHTPEHFFPANLLQTNSAPSLPKRIKILGPVSLPRKDPSIDNSPYVLVGSKNL